MKTIFTRDINFDELNHSFSLDDDPSVTFTSVTTFIGQFFKPFDAYGIALKLTSSHPNYIGMSPEELMDVWERKTKAGSFVHSEIDEFIRNGTLPSRNLSLKAVEWLNSLDRSKYDLISETVVFSKEIRIAGIVDILLLNKKENTIDIYDWKTTVKIEKSSFGNRMGIKPATANVPDCNFYHYSLQLSLYKYIIENYYGMRVNKMMLLHLTENSIAPYECSDMTNVIERMLTGQL